jgi:hypothetical protein
VAAHWTFQLSDQLATVAVTMGERLGSDDARCSTQIGGYSRSSSGLLQLR